MLFQPRENGSLIFGPKHPIQFDVSTLTKIVPPDLKDGNFVNYWEDDVLATQEDITRTDVGGLVHLTMSDELGV